MKELSIEQKAKAYNEALKAAIAAHKDEDRHLKATLERIFPELKESDDERVRKEIIETFKNLGDGKIPVDINYADIFTWLEKQGKQKPSDEDMKEALRTEYEKGRADAIAEMEKPTWSVGDMSKVQRICKYLNEAKKYYADITEVRECMDWLKSLRPQNRWKPTNEQMEALDNFIFAKYPNIEKYEKSVISLYQDLKKLKG